MKPTTHVTPAIRRIAVAAALACAAIALPAAAAAVPASPVRSAESAVPGLCETPGLVVWLDTNGSGAAGSVYYKLEFTNLSGHRCTLNGFTFLFAVNLRGKQVGRRAGFDHSAAPHQVTLGRGKTAFALLRVVQVSLFTHAACRPVTAAGFKVFPPNQTRAKVVPFPFGACSRHGPLFLSVRPVQK